MFCPLYLFFFSSFCLHATRSLMSQTPHEKINTCACHRENPDNSCSHILPNPCFVEPADNDPHPKYPCGTCLRNVSDRNKAFQCNACNYWNHIKCDGILPYDYDKFQKLPQAVKDKKIHFCKKCTESSLPFQKLLDDEFTISVVKNMDYNEDLNLRNCPPPGIKRLFTDFS